MIDSTILTEVLLNGIHMTIIYYMLLFSQGCLDLDVSRHITTIEKKLKKYFPDENIATDKTSIFDCVAECFTKTNYFIYYVSLIIIVVIEKNKINKGNI
jgi:hypothetical protein